MAEVQETFNKTKQVWRVVKHFENVDLDQVVLQVFEDGTENMLLDMSWNAKDFFKQMLDLQYEYGR